MKKLVGLILCTLLISTVSVVAQNGVTDTVTQNTSTTGLDDDVPVWEVGNIWSYKVDTFSIQFIASGKLIGLDLSVESLDLEVVGTTATSYLLDISGKISGTVLFDDGAGIRLSGSLFFTRLEGSMQFRQADLAAEGETIVISTIALITEHPLPIAIPLPIPLTITLNIAHGTPRPFIDFPLFDGKQGILSETTISGDILVESIVLRILHIFNPDLPEEISLEQNFSLPMVVYTATEENITVEAGDFTAYNIEFFEGLLGSMYYAPAAGNIIKADAELVSSDLAVIFHGELKDTNYV